MEAAYSIGRRIIPEFGHIRFLSSPNARLWIYNLSMDQIEGPFTYSDNELHGQMWTPAILGDELVLEVSLPTVEKMVENDRRKGKSRFSRHFFYVIG